MAVLGDSAQLSDREAVLLVVLAWRVDGLATGGGGAGEVFFPGVGVELRSGATLSFAHGLRLVVGRKHMRLVFAPERLRLLGRGIEQARALADPLSGGVGHKRQLSACSPIGHDMAAADVAAELYMRMLAHASTMAGATVCANRDRSLVRVPAVETAGGSATPGPRRSGSRERL